MGASKPRSLDDLLRRLAAIPETEGVEESPGRVRPGVLLADRFEIEAQLGAGGMGRVFAARDRVRQDRVAVKLLGRLTPQSISQLKREFRSVAELVHPNLVRLDELFSDGVDWFFSMDLVDGVTLSELLERTADGAARWDGIRRVFSQLAVALQALHDAGMLHSDLKPSNFLIARRDDRVVLLDFGLARPIGVAAPHEHVGGTPGYMAPEQRLGESLTEAADWYAFGVVLHRALTGEFPSARTRPDALLGAPEDLARLCLELLAPRPEDRPRGREVLGRIGPLSAPPAGAAVPPVPRRAPVGREPELAALEAAFQAAASGRPTIALLVGPSGIGKTSLAAAFVASARDRGALALCCTCRERESMPYKAVDGLVDDVVGLLDALPPAKARALLPRHLAELTILFPGLRQARVVSRAPVEEVEAEPTLVRLRAIAAFGELLANLRRRAPVILWIDDLQWSDAESALLLGPALGGPEPVPVLVIGGCRAAAPGAAQAPSAAPPAWPVVDALLADRNLRIAPPAELALAPLGPDAAARLARDLLAGDARAAAGDIARESAGHPLFIAELALAAARATGARTGRVASTTLQELIAERVAALPAGARRLLELTAIAGAPLPRSVLIRAQGLPVAEGEARLDVLRANRLARTQGTREDDAVDVHHDRIREIVVHGISTVERRDGHLALARALEARPASQPDFVAVHYEAAGELGVASRHWLRAADQASRALAFDHAAELYAKAIHHAPLEPGALRELHVKRAEALARAGKGPAAADVYLATAEGCAPGEAVELRRRAAEQLLLSGHLDRGLAVIEDVLRAIGMRGTRSGRLGLLSVLAGRARVRARGLGHVPRAEHVLSREELARLDTSWTIACSLGGIDVIRGADFQNEHLLLALRSGEPRRLLRALTLEASYSAIPGIGSERRIAQVLAVADALARTGADETAIAFLSVTRGVSAYLQGRLDEALVHLEGAAELLAHRGAGAVLETLTARRFLIACLFFLGRLRRLGELVPPLLADAEGTGNIYATMVFRTGYSSAAWLARDDVREASRQLVRAREEWSAGGGFQLSHLNMLLAELYLDLYAGDCERARARLDEQWPAIREAQLLHVAVPRAQLLQLRAASGAAAADRADARGERARAAALRREARTDVHRLGRERIARARPWAALVDAALAWSSADEARTRRHLEDAIDEFDARGMQLYAAAARVRLGERTRHELGGAIARAGYDALGREGIVNPARLVEMLAPGFGSAPAW